MKINCRKSIRLLGAIFAAVFFASCQNPLLIDATKLYKVSFETNCSEQIESYRTSKIETSPAINKTGYNLIGWSENSQSDKTVSFPLELESDTVLYAVWKICYYTVVFNSRGGTEIQAQSVPYNSVATLPDEPKKEESEFLGWYTDISFSEKFDFGTPVTSDITLYAKWKTNTYPVYFNNNGGDGIEKLDIEFKDYVPYDVTPTKIGYVFVSWCLDENLTQKFDFATPVTKSITLYAKWEAAGDTKYTVIHNKQNEQRNGYIVAASESHSGETNSLTAATAENYVGFTAKPFDQIAIKPDGTSIVYIYYDRNSYTVSFDANGGSGTMSSEKFYYEVPKALIENTFIPATGYEFSGWANSKGGSKVYEDKGIGHFTSDATLYAKWNTTSYTIYYELNGGVIANENPTSYTIETPTITLKNPTRTDYSFAGWYTNSSFTGNKITEIEKGSYGTKSFYAKWTPTSYAITYNLNGGTNDSANPASYTIETETFALNAPTRIGYAFGGWYETNDFSGNAVTTIVAGSTGNRTLYARWIQDENLTVVASDEVDGLDVSALTEGKTLIITGEISPATLTTLSTKITGINSDIHLDLSVTTGLTEISGPESRSIFKDCKHLKSIVLPNTLETIGSYAFYFCTSLTNITIPDSVTSIGDSAFTGCSGLTSITIPDSVTSIGGFAFSHNSSLASITIPDSVTSIGYYAFSGCSGLTTITIPATVTRIGYHAFNECTKLKSIIFSDTSTWYYTSNSNYTGGTQKNVEYPYSNASYFTSTYKDKYWYKE